MRTLWVPALNEIELVGDGMVTFNLGLLAATYLLTSRAPTTIVRVLYSNGG